MDNIEKIREDETEFNNFSSPSSPCNPFDSREHLRSESQNESGGQCDSGSNDEPDGLCGTGGSCETISHGESGGQCDTKFPTNVHTVQSIDQRVDSEIKIHSQSRQNKHTKKNKVILGLLILNIILISVLSFISVNVLITPDISISYYNLDPKTIAEQVNAGLNNFPAHIRRDLSLNEIEIYLLSGITMSVTEDGAYVYEGFKVDTGDPGSQASTGDQESQGLNGNKGEQAPQGSPNPQGDSDTQGSSNTSNSSPLSGTVLGNYIVDKHRILIFVDNVEKTRTYTVEGVLAHEIGHFMWRSTMSNITKSKFTECFNSEELDQFSLLTGKSYCKTSADEYFSEYLRYYVTGTLEETELASKTPQSLSVVKGILETSWNNVNPLNLRIRKY